jgi:hypothetical protein
MKISRMPVEPNVVRAVEDRLDSWKEIAAYLRKGLRTVQRWERTEGLPVRRLGQGSVFAYNSELDAWWRTHSHTLPPEPEPIAPEIESPPTTVGLSQKRVDAIAFAVAAAAALTVWNFRPRAPETYRAVPLTADSQSNLGCQEWLRERERTRLGALHRGGPGSLKLRPTRAALQFCYKGPV